MKLINLVKGRQAAVEVSYRLTFNVGVTAQLRKAIYEMPFPSDFTPASELRKGL